ncbi:hypothetical protein WA158_004534 [Blastocystis sp. Blastoise]
MTDSDKKCHFERIRTTRGFSVIEQHVYLDIDPENETIDGHTEVVIIPHLKKIKDIRLNCRQCSIVSVSANNLSCGFTLYDFMKDNINGTIRSPESYYAYLPADTGELFIKFPDELFVHRMKRKPVAFTNNDDAASLTPSNDNADTVSVLSDTSVRTESTIYSKPSISSKYMNISQNNDVYFYKYQPIVLSIRYRLVKPEGSLFFQTAGNTPHLYTWNTIDGYHIESSFGTGTRGWVPCIDDEIERYPWKLFYSIPPEYSLYSCGSFIEKMTNVETKKCIYKYEVNYPTPANNIGFTAGKYVEKNSNEDDIAPYHIYYAAPLEGTMAARLDAVTNQTRGIYDYIQSMFRSSFPIDMLPELTAVIFVDDSPGLFSIYQGLILLDSKLLFDEHDTFFLPHYAHIFITAYFLMYFGGYIQLYKWNDLWLPLGVASYLGLLYVQQNISNDIFKYYIKTMLITCCQIEEEREGLFPIHNEKELRPIYIDNEEYSCSTYIMQ